MKKHPRITGVVTITIIAIIALVGCAETTAPASPASTQPEGETLDLEATQTTLSITRTAVTQGQPPPVHPTQTPGGANNGSGKNTGLQALIQEVVYTRMAEALDLSLTEFNDALAEGKTPQDLAVEMSVNPATLQTARNEAMAQLVADGTITQEQADQAFSKDQEGAGNGSGGQGQKGNGQSGSGGNFGGQGQKGTGQTGETQPSGEELTPSCTDYDGTDYSVVKIGDQWWTAENLSSEHYSDGTLITEAYDDGTDYLATFGKVYTWEAVMNGEPSSESNPSGVQGICPVGWHVPSDAEWTELTDYLGGTSAAGEKMKSTDLWIEPNVATNQSGFSFLPSGGYSDGSFNKVGESGHAWSATEVDSSDAWLRGLNYSVSGVKRYSSTKTMGLSVRCIADISNDTNENVSNEMPEDSNNDIEPAQELTWEQINENGFEKQDKRISGMTVFDGSLYAGTINQADGAQVWRYDGDTWAQVNKDGFGENNMAVQGITVFDGELYVGVRNDTGGVNDNDTENMTGAQVWRYDGGTTWTQVNEDGFGNAPSGYNRSVESMAIFDGNLYAGTWNDDDGAQVWRYDGGTTWTQVNDDGFGNMPSGGFSVALSMTIFDDELYVGTRNDNTGTEVWRYDGGTTWTQVNENGFGNTSNQAIWSLVEYDGSLYAGTMNMPQGGQVWRYDGGTTWTQVNESGFGNIKNGMITSMAVLDGQLCVGTNNKTDNTQVWCLTK